jgi:outer membrane protein assembly factor BamE (lipoprotein component of BamABCDE complex)
VRALRGAGAFDRTGHPEKIAPGAIPGVQKTAQSEKMAEKCRARSGRQAPAVRNSWRGTAGRQLTDEVRGLIMTAWLKLLTVFLLLTASACVSAGARTITDTDAVSRIEAGSSTRADVAALLGNPLTASYGEAGEETWHYAYVTLAPHPSQFVPVVKALTPQLIETTRELSITFDGAGTVKNLERRAAAPPEPPAAAK